MLTKVQFRSIRSLHDVQIDLDRLTVLVGPNGCGKSTLLDQIDNLCAMSHPDRNNRHVLGSIGEVIQERGLVRQRSRGVSAPMTWEGHTDDDRAFSVTLTAPEERSWWNHILATTANATDTTATLNSQQGGEELSASRKTFEDTLDSHFSWRALRLGLVPSRIAQPVDVRVTSLARDGTGVPALLADLALNDQDAYAKLQDDLRAIVPHFEKLQIDRTDITSGGQTLGGLRLSMFMRGAGLLPASEVSDGTRIALALLTATHNHRMPRLVLMDDVDHGLHLGAQFTLIEAIRRVMAVRPELQVICTTHSPYLLDAVQPEEVRVMALDPEGRTAVRPLTEYPDAQQLRGLQTGEGWATVGESWVVQGE